MERAYFAGLWDGDGSFGIAKRVGRRIGYQPFCHITLCDPKAEIIYKDLELMGFRFTQWFQQRNPKHKPAYRWAMYSSKACRFATWIEPDLVIKKERAQILIAWPNILRTLSFKERESIHDRQIELYERMKVLNKRGTSWA